MNQVLDFDSQLNAFKTTLDGASVIITPQVGKAPLNQSSKWKEEAWLNIQLQDLTSKALTIPSFADGKLGWQDEKGNIHKHFVKSDPNGFTSDGLLEHEIILYSKPVSNLLTFSVDCSPNIEWFYQPVLTVQEIANGDLRPPNVVGSYALYIDKAHNEYKTGKYCHIYALTLTDAVGKISYASLNWNPSIKILTATMDKAWLQKAAYPVTIDPEIGYSGTPGSESGILPDAFRLAPYLYTGVTGDKVTAFHAYARTTSAAGTIDVAAYDFSGGYPVNMLTHSVTQISISNTTIAWKDSAAVSQDLVNGTDYTVASGNGSNANMRIGYDTTTNVYNLSRHNTVNDTLPDPWVQVATAARIYGLYATVTAGGGPSTWSYTGSGLLQSAGAALPSKTKAFLASGLLQSGGIAAWSKTKAFLASGGIESGGLANTEFGHVYIYTASGGLQYAGTALLAKIKDFLASGILKTSGIGETYFGYVYTYTASGGLQYAGIALISKDKVFAGSGHLEIEGEAGLTKIRSFISSGHKIIRFEGQAGISRIVINDWGTPRLALDDDGDWFWRGKQH